VCQGPVSWPFFLHIKPKKAGKRKRATGCAISSEKERNAEEGGQSCPLSAVGERGAAGGVLRKKRKEGP